MPYLNQQDNRPLFKRPRTVVNQVTLLVIFFEVFAICLWGFFSYRSSKTELLGSIHRRFMAAATYSVSEASHFHSHLQQGEIFVNRILSTLDLPQAQDGNFLNIYMRSHQDIVEISVIGTNGIEKIRLSKTEPVSIMQGRDFSDHPLFLKASQGSKTISPVTFSEFNYPELLSAFPLGPSLNNGQHHVLLSRVNLTWLWDWTKNLPIGDTGYVYVLDRDLRVIAHPDPSVVLANRNAQELTEAAGLFSGPQNNQIIQYANFNGQQVLGVSLPDPVSGWQVVVEQPVTECLAPLQRIIYTYGFALLLAIVLSIPAINYFSGVITRPLSLFRQGIKRISEGERGVAIELPDNTELISLADDFNLMARSLDSTITELEASKIETEEAKNEIARLLDKLRAIFASMADGICGLDKECHILFMNPAAEQLLGWKEEEVLGAFFPDLVTCPDDAEHWREISMLEVINRSLVVRNEDYSFCRKKDKPISVAYTIAPLKEGTENVGAVLSFRDIRQAKQMEQKLRQSQKMEAIGTLASGIAHDFNNILTPILGYTEMIILDMEQDDPLSEPLSEILNAANRAKELIRQILAFSRQHEQERIPIEPGLITKEALKLLRSSLPTTIEILQQIKTDIGYVLADPIQLHQVVMNLCTNGYHAMQDRGGVLLVTVEPIQFDQEQIITKVAIPAGKYIRLAVSDNGHGIAIGDLEKIFEPYFTTKKLGEGTGMGLAVVHGIIKRHDGRITVESKLSGGTTFTVYLPCIEDKFIHLGENAPRESIPTGNERILFVDDEEVVVSMARQMLEDLGYQVTTMLHSPEALELFASGPENFDLIITDMTMPIMTGAELAKRAIAICKDIPVILCSGFNDLITQELLDKHGIREFLPKPIIIMDIAKTIRKVLN